MKQRKSACGRLQREYNRDMAKRPPKPAAKGPLSAWTLFVRENYSRVASEHPTVRQRAMLSEVPPADWPGPGEETLCEVTQCSPRTLNEAQCNTTFVVASKAGAGMVLVLTGACVLCA